MVALWTRFDGATDYYGCNILSHAAAAWLLTRESVWIASGMCIGLIGPYMEIVLGEDINAVRQGTTH
eukprot:scaffold27386_cov53-Attheya_sp.AAC.4